MLLLGVGINAQSLHIRDTFKKMPDSIMPYLTENNRLDMLDFFDSKMKAIVTNTLQGKSCLEALSDSYLRISTDSSALVEMKLLPSSVTLPDTTQYIICLVHTYGSVCMESDVTFYTSKWRKLPVNFDINSYVGQLFAKPDTMSAAVYDSLLVYKSDLAVSAALSSTETTLTLKPFVPLIDTAEKRKLLPVLCSKTLAWNGKGFK